MSTIRRETWMRLVASVVTERGTERPDWTQVTETEVAFCRFQPIAGDELTEFGRQGVVERGTLYAPIGSFGPHDRARSPSGAVWEVDGPPRDWKSPTGYLEHQEVPLRKVVG